MAKEIRAGWYVVGTLLVMFCTVLGVRFSSPSGSGADVWVSITSTENSESDDSSAERERNPQVRFHPTIVKSSNWDLVEFPAGGEVRPASAYVDEEIPRRLNSTPIRVETYDPRPVPSDEASGLVNPREHPLRPIPHPLTATGLVAPDSSARD